MAFDYDVFISYTHIDNEPLGESRKGWIAMLEAALRTRLAQYLGEKPRIWRDRKLDGNDHFDQEIMQKLVHAAILVSVLSPRYLKSEWCRRELATFFETAESEHNLTIDNKSRIFKVLKTPVDEEPAEATSLLGYSFYKMDPETGRYREFDRIFGEELDLAFWRVLDDLAQDIRKLLKRLQNGGTAEHTGAIVYLAETTLDLEEDRNQIRRELEDRGHLVLPDSPLPLRGKDLEAVIDGYLERAELSVHPIGASYGVVPEGRDRSLHEIENELAAKRSREGKLIRLVWMPPDLKTGNEHQQKFIEALNNDPDLTDQDGVLETTREELKTVINDRLEVGKKAPKKEQAPAFQRVYLICDDRDAEAAQSIDDWLYEQELEVWRPLRGGSAADSEKDHEERLGIADGVVIYFGDADEAWISRMILDLARIPAAHGRASAVYLAGPETPFKKRYRTREVDAVIKAFEGFDGEALAPFLSALATKRRGEER